MGCCDGEREKGEVAQEQRWEYITLSDFKATSCGAPFSYVWLWFLVIVAVAVTAVDVFTAINLLAFDKWSSKIEPAIPFAVSKWIFAVTILISFVLLAYQWIQAVRHIRRGGVAESYLDPLAAVLQSIRPGGWRRFLVFAELTKSRKGTDYVALFVYFAFKGALRITLAEAPRQVVNALTLYSVMQADLIPVGAHATTQGRAKIVQFFMNVQILAKSNTQQALILFGMLFSLIIWVISALALIVAAVIYITFLWHHIPSRDGRLSIYCRRKINKRVEQLVSKKVKQVIEDEEKKRLRAERKALKHDKHSPNDVKRQPTLPAIGSTKEEEIEMPSLDRQASFATLPPYTSQPPTPGAPLKQPTLPDVSGYFPGGPRRTATSQSSNSFSSSTPMLRAASPMGYSNEDSVHPMPERSLTMSSQASQSSRSLGNRPPMGVPAPSYRTIAPDTRPPMGTPAPSYRTNAPDAQPTMATPAPSYRTNAPDSQFHGYPTRQNTQDSTAPSFGPLSRTNTDMSMARSIRQPTRVDTNMGMGPPNRSNTDLSMGLPSGPSRTNTNYSVGSRPTPATTPATPASAGYVAFNPRNQSPVARTPSNESTIPAVRPPPQAHGYNSLPQRPNAYTANSSNTTAPGAASGTYDDNIYDAYA